MHAATKDLSHLHRGTHKIGSTLIHEVLFAAVIAGAALVFAVAMVRSPLGRSRCATSSSMTTGTGLFMVACAE